MRKKELDIPGIDVEASCKRIAQIIDESGFSDKSIAKMMRLSVQAINKWRNGHNLPDIENLFILSRILGVKVDDFLVQRESAAEVGGFPASSFRRIRAYYIRLSKALHKNDGRRKLG